MKHRKELEYSYPDLLTEQADPALLKLVQELDATYTASEQPEGLSWATIKAKHMQTTTRPQPAAPFAWLRPARGFSFRMGAIVAVLLIALVFAGAVQANLVPLFGKLFDNEPGIQAVVQDDQFTTIHQTKTLPGLPITLEAVYADANRIIIVLTYKLDNFRKYPGLGFPGPELMTEQGVELQASGIISNPRMDSKQREARMAWLYEAPAITDSPKTIHLRARLSIGPPCKLGKAVIGQAKTIGNKLGCVPDPHSITFDFSVPFHPGKVITLNQSQTAGGGTLTLERVVITRAETRFYVHGMDYNHARAYVERLSVQGDAQQFSWQDTTMETNKSNTVAFMYDYSLADKHGRWTLEIKWDCPGCMLRPVGGPWKFQFVVP